MEEVSIVSNHDHEFFCLCLMRYLRYLCIYAHMKFSIRSFMLTELSKSVLRNIYTKLQNENRPAIS